MFWKTTFIFLSWLCYFGYMPGSHSSPFLSLSNLVHSFSSASCQIPITALKPFYCRLPLFSYVYCCGHLTSDLLAHSLISLYFILNKRCIHSPYLVPVSFIQSYAYHSPDSAFVPEMLNYLMLFCISGFWILITWNTSSFYMGIIEYTNRSIVQYSRQELKF